MSNVTRVAPLHTAVDQGFVTTASLGGTVVVPLVAGKRIRVLSAAVVTTLANSVKFQSAANDASALFPLGANGGLVLSFNEHGWVQTAIGEELNINLSVATSTAVHITYQYI